MSNRANALRYNGSPSIGFGGGSSSGDGPGLLDRLMGNVNPEGGPVIGPDGSITFAPYKGSGYAGRVAAQGNMRMMELLQQAAMEKQLQELRNSGMLENTKLEGLNAENLARMQGDIFDRHAKLAGDIADKALKSKQFADEASKQGIVAFDPATGQPTEAGKTLAGQIGNSIASNILLRGQLENNFLKSPEAQSSYNTGMKYQNLAPAGKFAKDFQMNAPGNSISTMPGFSEQGGVNISDPSILRGPTQTENLVPGIGGVPIPLKEMTPGQFTPAKVPLNTNIVNNIIKGMSSSPTDLPTPEESKSLIDYFKNINSSFGANDQKISNPYYSPDYNQLSSDRNVILSPQSISNLFQTR